MAYFFGKNTFEKRKMQSKVMILQKNKKRILLQ